MFKPKKTAKGFGNSEIRKSDKKIFSIKEKLEYANKKRINKEYNEAINIYNKIIKLHRETPEAFYNLGLIYKSLNSFNESINAFKEVINIEPGNIGAYLLIGNIFLKLKKYENAIEFYEKGLSLNREDIYLLNGLGNVYHQKNEHATAILFFKKAINLSKNNAGIFNNLGNSQLASLQIKNAIVSFCSAIKINPEVKEFHLNLAYAYFYNNDYSNGWIEYEYRKRLNNLIANKVWNGQPLKDGETLLIYWEEGLGDSIQFVRYAIHFKNLGLNFKLCIQEKLHPLIKNTNLKENLLSSEDFDFEKFDYYIGLISLPRILKIKYGEAITSGKYLKCPDNLKEKWKINFQKNNSYVIGINWQGNPKAEMASGYGRSMSLENFASIANKYNIKFLSLQKGYGSEQLSNCSFRGNFVDFQDKCTLIYDFLECAAMIENCNLIITTDTCVAHLAGAMGKRTWLLLKKIPDWRWGIMGKKTFWYDSIRIFRQEKANNWSSVMEEIESILLKDPFFKNLNNLN